MALLLTRIFNEDDSENILSLVKVIFSFMASVSEIFTFYGICVRKYCLIMASVSFFYA